MRTILRKLRIVLCCTILICVAASVPAVAEEQDFTELAKRIVNTSANVEPGEVVVVAGGKHMIPLMEAVTIEVQKAGGMPTMFLSSDRVARSRWTEVADEFLMQEPRFMVEWIKQVDVWIGLPQIKDFQSVRKDVPESKVAKSDKARQIVGASLDEAKERFVFVMRPSRDYAETNGIDFAKIEKMHSAALNADYAKLAQQASKLAQILKSAKQMRITSANGTDLTVAIGDRLISVNDGVVTADGSRDKPFFQRIATLPTGSVFFAPLEDSASGRVVTSGLRTRMGPLTGIDFEFKNGKMANFKAEQGAEDFQQIMAAYQGPKDVIASISIGLNPAAHVLEGSKATFYPWYGAGMVVVGIGNNKLLGGKNTESGGFTFPIQDATVTIDGKVVVQEGKVKL